MGEELMTVRELAMKSSFKEKVTYTLID